MTLLLLLVLGVAASAGSAWALARGGTAARLGAIGGVLALVLIAALAAASPTPSSLTPDDAGSVPGTLWNGALVPGAYLRLVVVLWSASSVVLVGVAWLLRGTAGLRGLLPASLSALVGAAVALAAATPALGVVAGGATGLAAIPIVLATPRSAATGVAAREVRNAVATALIVLAVASLTPVLARLVLADPDSASGGSGAVAAVSFGLLAMAVVLAARLGGIPYHVRVSALTDIAPSGSLPLVAAWLPLPFATVAVGIAVGVLAPIAPPVGPAQALIVAATLLATLAACLVAFLQDDLRHAVGYLTIADLGLVLLVLAALDQELWGPARVWLLTAAVTKTALAAWAVVVEDRFETRAVPDLRGWMRPSPMLAVALLLIMLATYGLPGWAVMTARTDLAGHAAGAPWSAVVLVVSLLTLPAYLRWLWLGIGVPTTHVERSVPEFAGLDAARLPARRLAIPAPRRGSADTLPVEQERSDEEPGTPAGGDWPADAAVAEAAVPPRAARSTSSLAARTRAAARLGGTTMMSAPAAPEARAGTGRPTRRTGLAGGGDGAGSRGQEPVTGNDDGVPRRAREADPRPDAAARAAETVRRHRTGLLSGAVLALALLASLVAFGSFGVAQAAGEPTPAVAGVVLGGN